MLAWLKENYLLFDRANYSNWELIKNEDITYNDTETIQIEKR